MNAKEWNHWTQSLGFIWLDFLDIRCTYQNLANVPFQGFKVQSFIFCIFLINWSHYVVRVTLWIALLWGSLVHYAQGISRELALCQYAVLIFSNPLRCCMGLGCTMNLACLTLRTARWNALCLSWHLKHCSVIWAGVCCQKASWKKEANIKSSFCNTSKQLPAKCSTVYSMFTSWRWIRENGGFILISFFYN